LTQAAQSNTTSDAYKAEYSTELAGKWDQLVNWGNRHADEATFFVDLLRRYGACTVLDAAAGTGYHPWVLATSGFAVTASDGAQTMVDQCVRNLSGRGVELPVLRADWRELDTVVGGSYDAVLCLGNSFSHLFDDDDRKDVLAQFRSVLKPGGILVLDHRNYDAILRDGFVEQRTSYCCGADDVVITAASVEAELVQLRYDFPDGTGYDVRQSPVLQEAMTRSLEAAGFGETHRFGDMAADYDPLAVDFVVHVARRPL
jgi:SAM-dependent methyltransferase